MNERTYVRSYDGRKYVNEGPMQRQVAQKLQLCADVNDSFSARQHSLAKQYARYQTQKSRANELHRMHVAVDQILHSQTLLGTEMNRDRVLSARLKPIITQTDKVLTRLSRYRTKPAAYCTKKNAQYVSMLIETTARVIAERQQRERELPARHQWVPPVLWTIYNKVYQAACKEERAQTLYDAMHDVMKVIQRRNSFFYLQVLYQPPPAYCRKQYTLTASIVLKKMTTKMAKLIRALDHSSLALCQYRNAFVRIHKDWDLALTLVRKVARYFHEMMLHLYEVIMGCATSDVDDEVLLERAISGDFKDEKEFRSELQLHCDVAASEDHLVRESYVFTPGLLVFLQKWRSSRDQEVFDFHFAYNKRYARFLPRHASKHEVRDFKRYYIPSSFAFSEIRHHVSKIKHTWHSSRLGAYRMKSMKIQELGQFEQRMKNQLGILVNVIYQVMLVRWMNRKMRFPESWRVLDCVEEARSEDVKGTGLSAMGGTSESGYDGTDVESIEHHDARLLTSRQKANSSFRRPCVVSLREVHSKAISLKQSVGKNDGSETSREAMSMVTKRLYGQTTVTGLLEQLQWSTFASKSLKETDSMSEDWRVTCATCQVCSVTEKALRLMETNASHDGDSATEKRLSSFSSETKVASIKKGSNFNDFNSFSDDPTIKELSENVKKANQNIAETFAMYDGNQSFQWRHAIVDTGIATVELLRTISQDEAVHL